jgi:hypothetical protein
MHLWATRLSEYWTWGGMKGIWTHLGDNIKINVIVDFKEFLQGACHSRLLFISLCPSCHILNIIHHLRMEADPVSETLCFLVFRIPADGQGSKSKWLWADGVLRIGLICLSGGLLWTRYWTMGVPWRVGKSLSSGATDSSEQGRCWMELVS